MVWQARAAPAALVHSSIQESGPLCHSLAEATRHLGKNDGVARQGGDVLRAEQIAQGDQSITPARPTDEQFLERTLVLHSLKLGTQGEYVVAVDAGGFGENSLGCLGGRSRFADEEFVKRGQRCRNLRTVHEFPINDRNEGEIPPAITGIAEAEALRQAQGMTIHSPARRSMGLCLRTKNRGKTPAGLFHFGFNPGVVGSRDELFLAHTMPGMDADFKTGIARLPHAVGAADPDIGYRQEQPVEARDEVVVAAW